MTSCNLCHGGYRYAYFLGELYHSKALKRGVVRCACQAGQRLSEKIPSIEQAKASPRFARWIELEKVIDSREVIFLDGESNEKKEGMSAQEKDKGRREPADDRGVR